MSWGNNKSLCSIRWILPAKSAIENSIFGQLNKVAN